MMRFIHSSDLHLGKRFGNFSGDLPGRLREARHAVIAKLARHAREQGADTILLAGDTFDTETPSADIRRQALAEMKLHAPVRWLILPGNHDSLQATELWSMLASEVPDNVVLTTTPEAIELGPHAVLLPAPCTTRRPGRDLSAWMDEAATEQGVIRVGMAHGPIRSFSEDTNASEIIAPDRARSAGLDYFALGDWHGAVEIDARTHYSGAPEQDRFKHGRKGTALLVEIDGVGAVPRTTPLDTATFAWRNFEVHLLAADDPTSALAAQLPEPSERRQTLAKVVATGRAGLAERTTLAQAVGEAAPEFAYLELDEADLAIDFEVDDLDRIDRGGALREAADALLVESGDPARSEFERGIAKDALVRLYGYAQTVSS